MSTILVVDDDAANRQLLSSLLGYRGHRTIEAASATEGLRQAGMERPDLMIVDIQMPVMDGYEFVRTLRQHPEHARTPVMFYTATYDPERARRVARDYGVPVVLTKPLEPAQLFDSVERVLGTDTSDDVPVSAEAERAHLRLVADKLHDKVQEARTLSQRLAALLALSEALNVEQSVPELLRTIVSAGRDVMNAHYTGVGILDADRRALTYFVACGADGMVNGEAPPLDGVLARLSDDRRVVRVAHADIAPGALGLPAGERTIHWFLGLPVASPHQHFGWIFFARLHDQNGAVQDDEQVAKALAAKLSVAYANLSLYRDLRQHADLLEMRVRERTQKLERAHDALEQARVRQIAVKDEFLAHVSHELRAPLAAADLFARNLLDGLEGALSDEQSEALGVVTRNTEQLSRMIGDLLDVTRADTGKLRLDCRPLDLRSLAADVVATVRANAGSHVLRADIAPDLPVVCADAQRIRQVLNNLLDNAIKFTPRGGTITVRVAAARGERAVQVDVEDTGPGIRADDQRHVFDRLYQGDNTADLPRGGLGLGLHICQMLVERHGGRIWVESTEGQGSRFSFVLPVEHGCAIAEGAQS